MMKILNERAKVSAFLFLAKFLSIVFQGAVQWLKQTLQEVAPLGDDVGCSLRFAEQRQGASVVGFQAGRQFNVDAIRRGVVGRNRAISPT